MEDKRNRDRPKRGWVEILDKRGGEERKLRIEIYDTGVKQKEASTPSPQIKLGKCAPKEEDS